MGLFSRKPSETTEQRYVRQALELRDGQAQKRCEVARQSEYRAYVEAARAADHGGPAQIAETHRQHQDAQQRYTAALSERDRWYERRYRR
ncbi:hypothetical protein [Peterkaempfera griseoplana]|uniref:hypothetical protein n=1 Tax=Peterkaempfera griseoplana TaxID=66896 RepID=UPI0006E21140|nr:hypothetical protein [Peterkaempfera griseoplana]